MTADEADQRITLSLNTLVKFDQMISAGVDPMPGTMTLIDGEISVLEEIAELHPGKVSKLLGLVSGWSALRQRLKAKLH